MERPPRAPREDSQGADCWKCRFYGTTRNGDAICRAHPPKVAAHVIPIPVETPEGTKIQTNVTTTTSWPAIEEGQWCGEFQQQRGKADA